MLHLACQVMSPHAQKENIQYFVINYEQLLNMLCQYYFLKRFFFLIFCITQQTDHLLSHQIN